MLTDGRPHILTTLPAWRHTLGLHPIVVDDSGDTVRRDWIHNQGAQVEPVDTTRQGYTPAMRRVMQVAVDTGARWVFLTEDDFLPLGPMPLPAMTQVLTDHPHLVQIVLKRQPWYENEKRAGGVLEAINESTRDHSMLLKRSGLDQWVEHRAFWSCNPTLFPTWVAARGWPDGPWSEGQFGRALFAEKASRRAAMWGEWGCDPQVAHIGTEKAGHGY
jgi:hypothetical protein